MDVLACKDFISRWREYSVATLRLRGIPQECGPRRRRWEHDHPIGEIDHFTGGVSFWGSCSWGNSVKNRNSSFPIVIADRILPDAPPMPRELAKYLTVTALLISDLEMGHWHGNWTNSRTVGKEHRNTGALKEEGGRFFWWGGEYDPERLGRPVRIDGKWYEPYSVDQLATSIWISRVLATIHPFSPSWVLPHSAVKWGKMDTGRAFPMNMFREAVLSPVFGLVDPYELPWMGRFKKAPERTLSRLEADEHVRYEELMLARSFDDDPRDEATGIEPVYDRDLGELIDGGKWQDNLPAISRGLHMLGYHVTDPAMSAGDNVVAYDDALERAVWQFQKSSPKLKDDKVPGPITQRALHKRLKMFQLAAM